MKGKKEGLATSRREIKLDSFNFGQGDYEYDKWYFDRKGSKTTVLYTIRHEEKVISDRRPNVRRTGT